MLRAEQFRKDTANFWSDLDQKKKSARGRATGKADKSPTCQASHSAC